MFYQDELAVMAGKVLLATEIQSPTFRSSFHNMYMHKQQILSSQRISPNYKNRMAYWQGKARIMQTILTLCISYPQLFYNLTKITIIYNQ